ncbi:MAG TPA: transcription antitermination factor NusB [Polyangiaceae bacterium]|jgi:16S rRNA (cytosine967-C5)-methyltransferase|nr:transcription antitermination factor NusB [Polyangiaceae bacterium]
MTSAREVAARVIERVEKERAFASAALQAELSRAVQLDARDRALATELVYGSLRVMPWLDEQLARFAPQGTRKLDRRVRAHLITAAYQLAFMRVPAFAAVSEAVDSVRHARGDRLAAFANAVLRKFAKHASELGRVDREQAVLASTPAWLRDALDRVLSPAGAQAFLRSGIEPPAVALRVEVASERDTWLARLCQATPDGRFELGRVSPLAILARGAGKPQQLVGYQEGAWSVQEEGSQLAALAVGARTGEVVLDACAGRGNKAAVLARQVGVSGAVDVCDAIPSKLDHLRAEFARCRLSARASFAIDWRVGSGELMQEYDRVLVDAPCSGTGTLRRRPEIALRREGTDLAAMAALQIAIASRAAAHVRRGGALFYVVCSLLREEAEDVVDEVVRRCPGFSPSPFDSPVARAIAGDAPSFRLLPHVHGTDGYFVAKLARH